jgi:hypothetical protein
MRIHRTACCLVLLLPSLVFAAPNPRLVLPQFKDLADKATQSVSRCWDSH